MDIVAYGKGLAAYEMIIRLHARNGSIDLGALKRTNEITDLR